MYPSTISYIKQFKFYIKIIKLQEFWTQTQCYENPFVNQKPHYIGCLTLQLLLSLVLSHCGSFPP